MTTSELTKLDATVSRLGFGAMRLPLLENGKIDRVKSAEMIDFAYKNGVNYYDTAYGYHNGESEEALCEALSRYPRDSYYLADKMPMFFCEEESDVERIFDEQLKRCGVEYFDFYLMHSLSRENFDAAKKFKAIEKMQKRRERGQIKRFGFSYHGDYDTFIEVLDSYQWDFVQLQINYIDDVKMRSKKFHDELTRRGIPCIVMEPVRGGFLANIPGEAREVLDETSKGESSAEIALRWCLSQENVPVVLSGMSTLDQVKENVRVFSDARPLSERELDAVARARDIILAIQTVPCTACSYCMDCPSGVNIPAVMHIYNDFKLYRNLFAFKQSYASLGDQRAEGCVACGVCSPKCPQGIDIPAWMETIRDEQESVEL